MAEQSSTNADSTTTLPRSSLMSSSRSTNRVCCKNMVDHGEGPTPAPGCRAKRLRRSQAVKVMLIAPDPD